MNGLRFGALLYWLKRSSVICGMALMLLFSGCGSQRDGNDSEEIALLSLEVYSAAENTRHIFHASYSPSRIYSSTHYDYNKKIKRAVNGMTTFINLENARSGDPKSENGITSEEVSYFINYISALPEEYVQGETLSYYIWCEYRDADGIEHSLFRRGDDEFPEGWDVFIDRYNEILGGNYLSGSGKVVAVTPEFLTELFGVTDEDVKEGTLQDVIDSQELDIVRVTGLFYMKDVLDYHYASLKEDIFAPYQPMELISVDSTEEEYNAFLERYLEKLGIDMSSEEKSDQGDYFRRFRINDQYEVYTARTVDLEHLPIVQGRDGQYYLLMDAGMEGMTYGQDFIYSADFKYILSPHSGDEYSYNPDIMLPFIE